MMFTKRSEGCTKDRLRGTQDMAPTIVIGRS